MCLVRLASLRDRPLVWLISYLPTTPNQRVRHIANMAMLSRRRHAGIAILLLLLLWLLQEETYKVQTVSLRRTVAIYSQHLVLSTKARRTLHLPEQFVLTQQNTFFATTKAEARFQPILKSLKVGHYIILQS